MAWKMGEEGQYPGVLKLGKILGLEPQLLMTVNSLFLKQTLPQKGERYRYLCAGASVRALAKSIFFKLSPIFRKYLTENITRVTMSSLIH
jgi:hypothetical protein